MTSRPPVTLSRTFAHHCPFLSCSSAKPAPLTASEVSSLSGEEKEKKAKAIRKKLKSIEEVKDKRTAGTVLDAGQVKLSCDHLVIIAGTIVAAIITVTKRAAGDKLDAERVYVVVILVIAAISCDRIPCNRSR